MNFLPEGKSRDRHQLLLVASLLILVTAAVYWQVVTDEFTNFDYPVYVTDNPRQAFELVAVQGNPTLSNALCAQIGLYHARLPFRDISPTNSPGVPNLSKPLIM